MSLFPQVYLNGATFNGPSQFEKTGATDNTSSGGNVYNGPVLLKTAEQEYCTYRTVRMLGRSATFQQTGTGILYPVYNHNNTFQEIFQPLVRMQTLHSSKWWYSDCEWKYRTNNFRKSIFAVTIRRFVMNNGTAGLTLAIPVTVTNTITLTSGMIYTTTSNPLIIDNGISTVNGVSNSSFVNGPGENR